MKNLFINLTVWQRIGLVVVVFFIPAVIIVSIVLMNLNNYPLAVIQNLDEYMVTASGNEKRELQQSLYGFLSERTNDDIDSLQIYIRDSSYSETNEDGVNYAYFLIDVDQIKASFSVYYVFPGDKFTDQNPIFDCPELSDMKYPETECVGMYNSTQKLKEEQANPISAILPIRIDEFDAETGETTRYDIRGYFDAENEDKFNISIIDYSCDNYEKALALIRKKGFDPDDYVIKVQDECFKEHLPHEGTNAFGNPYRVSVTTTDEGKLYFLINNYSCNKNNRKKTEEASVKAAENWLLTRNLKLSNYEYGVITFCVD